MRAGQRIVLTGANGSGKTTLLRTIAGQIPPLAGEVRLGASVRLGYMTQDQSGLEPDSTAVETLLPYFPNETEARTFLAIFPVHRRRAAQTECPAQLRAARPPDAGPAGGGGLQLPAAG